MVNIDELVGEQLELLRKKDVEFRRRLAKLQQAYGGGSRLSEELDKLEASDRAFANRVVAYDWVGLGETMVDRLRQAFLGEAPAVDASGRIAFYFDLERAEIGLRGRGVGGGDVRVRRARLFGKREVVLDLALVFDELVGGGQHTSSVYPIVFSHDAERNRRLVLTATVIELLWPQLTAMARGEVEGVRFPEHRELRLEIAASASGAALLTLTSREGAVDDVRISAVQIGFGAEREIERQLDEYVEVDADANYGRFLKERQTGAYERRDFVEPLGRSWSVRLDRERYEIEEYQRERPILTIKRAVRLLDAAPFVRTVEAFASEALADEGYERKVRLIIDQGFRQVYEEICGVSGVAEKQRGTALSWEEIAEN